MGIRVTEAKKGMVIRYQGELYQIAKYGHITPGNWRAIHHLNLKHVGDETFEAGGDVTEAGAQGGQEGGRTRGDFRNRGVAHGPPHLIGNIL